MNHDLVLQASLASAEALAKLLNAPHRIIRPEEFEEDDELAGFEFDGEDGFEMSLGEGVFCGVAFEGGQWVAWQQNLDV